MKAASSWSDVGLRDAQEDAAFASTDLLVVADGMGGHEGGAAASERAVAAIVEELSDGGSTADLTSAFDWACRCIEDGGAGGTTLVVAVCSGADAVIAWAGDSRAYLVRAGEAQLLTDDHLGPDGGLSRWLPDEGTPQIVEVGLREGDALVLCTDGVSGVLSEEEIAATVLSADEPAEEVVEAALEAGADDNCSAAVWVVH